MPQRLTPRPRPRDKPPPMAHFVFADQTNHYDGRSLGDRPLGGTESSVCWLTRALAARGHRVTAYTNCDGPVDHEGVAWRPLGSAMPDTCDVYVPVVHPKLFHLVKRPRRLVLWVMWPPNNLRHYKRVPVMWWYRPTPVFVSRFQVETYAPWLPRPDPQILIHFGLPPDVRDAGPREPPKPVAIFASNPERNLRWLLDVWDRMILPRVPGGELHVYGIQRYDWKYGDPWTTTLAAFVPATLSDAAKASIKLQRTATRDELNTAMRTARAMIYGGHKVEAFCLSVAEAQAQGLPAVLRPIGSLPERIIDGETGVLRADDAGFADASVRILTDDALWRRQHQAALAKMRGITWDECARQWEEKVLALPARR